MSNHSLPPPDQQEKPRQPGFPNWVWLVLATIFAINLILPNVTTISRQAEVSYTSFLSSVRAGEVEKVVLKGHEISATLRHIDNLSPQTAREIRTQAPEMGDPGLLPLLEKHNVEVVNEPVPGPSILVTILPWLLILGFYFWIWQRMSQGGAGGGPFGGGIKDFLSGSASKEQKTTEKVTFADVAGQENAKREVAELVEFLRDPEPFHKLGAEAPRGVLLMGPPGTGKTLLARALAGEAGVPFFSTSASEFIELYVGVGASRVRRMFEEAKARAPAIIFIDELDSIGRVRGTGLGGGHDEREQTLNQILAEMDGFGGHEAVVVLAATNRPDVLDPALLRPGRFDRHVTLTLPDRQARAAILKVHTRKVPLGASVDLDTAAAGTPGFSGADLKNLINEAAITAARHGASSVEMEHLDEARDKVMMGTVRTFAIQPEEKHRLAVHEAGHTAVAHFLALADPIYKVTIIPRGNALGGTHMLPEEERHTLPEDYLKDQLPVMLGGRAAEKVFLGSYSSGADDDIRRASQIARSMVARWGMSEAIGPVDLRQSEEHPFLGREIAQPRHFADQTAAAVDDEVKKLLHEAEERATEIIEDHRSDIEELVDQLQEEETLGQEAISACLGPRKHPPEDDSIVHLARHKKPTR